MATRATLKALVAADIVTNGNIRATELKSILDAIIDAIFDNDNVTRLSGNFSGASTYQNNALIGVSLENTILVIDGNEVNTNSYVSSFDSVTGTLTFAFAINGKYKFYIFQD